MKYFSTIILVAALSVLLISCSQSTVTPATSSPTPTATFTPATTPTITFTPTATNIPFPTIIPTINPTELPSLLKSAFSVETLADTNGYILRRISGWSDGFKKRSANPQGYQWMDANHLLLFPIVGEAQSPNWRTTLDRAVVINFETGEIWLPPSDLPISENWMLRFLLPRWSPEAQVLIAAENIGSGNTIKEGASIFKSDGTFVAHYDGRLTSVSPSGNKILIADDIWIELSNGKTVKFKWDEWDGETYTRRWLPIWSLDENQIYFCCYFYGNAKTGESYAFSEENSIFEGKPIRQDESLNHSYGIWLNDTYVLAQADGFYTGFVNFITFDSNFIPIFDPSARTFHNLGEKANLPNAYNIEYIRLSISPKRDYIWITPPSKSESDLPTRYLVNLKTFQSQVYSDKFSWSWSANGKYATSDLKVLTLSTKEIKTLPANEICWAWHPTESICSSVFLNEKKNSILLLQDVENMSVKKIELPASHVFSGTIWSPTGSHLALLTEDGSLWQIDYPGLENLEQLTPPVSNMNIESLIWSPDETHLSFSIGTDIYLVDTNNNP